MLCIYKAATAKNSPIPAYRVLSIPADGAAPVKVATGLVLEAGVDTTSGVMDATDGADVIGAAGGMTEELDMTDDMATGVVLEDIREIDAIVTDMTEDDDAGGV